MDDGRGGIMDVHCIACIRCRNETCEWPARCAPTGSDNALPASLNEHIAAVTRERFCSCCPARSAPARGLARFGCWAGCREASNLEGASITTCLAAARRHGRCDAGRVCNGERCNSATVRRLRAGRHRNGPVALME